MRMRRAAQTEAKLVFASLTPGRPVPFLPFKPISQNILYQPDQIFCVENKVGARGGFFL